MRTPTCADTCRNYAAGEHSKLCPDHRMVECGGCGSDVVMSSIIHCPDCGGDKCPHCDMGCGVPCLACEEFI